jgi:hypothetical protein
VGKQQGSNSDSVCGKEATTVRENELGGAIKKTEEVIWRFPNPLIFIG